MWEVTVAGTLSNLGPGYDVLGLAGTLTNRFRFSPSDVWRVGNQKVDPSEQLTLRTTRRAMVRFGHPCPALAVTQQEQVPRSRGLGSSATARVAGLLAYERFSRHTLTRQERLDFLIEDEGHPDNVSAALLGGLTICGRTARGWQVKSLPIKPVTVVVTVPDFEVSTIMAREKIPDSVRHSDAVLNLGWLGLLLHGLVTGDQESLRDGLHDRLHQAHRAPLCGPVGAVFRAAIDAGALGAFISGSGSTLAAMVPASSSQHVADAMQRAYPKEISTQALILRPGPAATTYDLEE